MPTPSGSGAVTVCGIPRSIVKDKQFQSVKKSLAGLGLNTVCEEAKCPNVGEV